MSDLYPKVHQNPSELKINSTDYPTIFVVSSILFGISSIVSFFYNVSFVIFFFQSYFISYLFLFGYFILTIFHVIVSIMVYVRNQSVLSYAKYTIPIQIVLIIFGALSRVSVIFEDLEILFIIWILILLAPMIFYYWNIFYHKPTIKFIRDYKSQEEIIFKKIVELEKKFKSNQDDAEWHLELKYFQQDKPKFFFFLSILVWIASLFLSINLMGSEAPGLNIYRLYNYYEYRQNYNAYRFINFFDIVYPILFGLLVLMVLFNIQVFRLKMQYFNLSRFFHVFFISLYLLFSILLNLFIGLFLRFRFFFDLNMLFAAILMMSPYILYYYVTYHRNSTKVFFNHYQSENQIIYDRIVLLEDKINRLVQNIPKKHVSQDKKLETIKKS